MDIDKKLHSIVAVPCRTKRSLEYKHFKYIFVNITAIFLI